MTHTFSVSELTSILKETLQQTFKEISLVGEISNFKAATSGHWYFQLNDSEATISGVMFKNKSWLIDFKPKDGDKVVVTGTLSVYEKRGSYQIICESMNHSGTGDILALLEKRKAEFASLGYFDQARKRTLMKYPKKVVVITSATGAALHDILTTLKRRASNIEVVVLPTLVQGFEAASRIAKQIEYANKHSLGDVIIVGRGGGSIEDLLPFSEKSVVEAIYNSKIITISGVGHETDWALSDYVSDLRASTPTAAAELVSEHYYNLTTQIAHYKSLINSLILNKVQLAKSRAQLFSVTSLGELLINKVQQSSLMVDDLKDQATASLTNKFQSFKNRYTLVASNLNNLSPLDVLNRGYAIVTNENNRVITSSKEVEVGQSLTIKFKEGQISSSVVKKGKSK